MTDINLAQHFLTVLDEDADKHVFFTMGGGDRANPTNIYGSLEEKVESLISQNEAGRNVWVTINHSSNGGREDADIDRVRAVFADLDGAPLPELATLPLEPHMIVESSPGRYHLYWLCDLPIEHFRGVQRRLVENYEADSSCINEARVLRLPGFIHQGSGAMTTIIHESGALPYTADEILAAFPPVPTNGHGNISSFHEHDTHGFRNILRTIGHGDEGDGMHMPITRSIAAFVAHHGGKLSTFARGALKDLIRARIEVATIRNDYDMGRIRQVTSDRYLDNSINGAIAKYGGKVEESAIPTEADFPIWPVDRLLEPLEPTQWLIGGLIEREQVGWLYGDTGSYKTFVALDMAMCIATGTKWHDRDVTQMPVMYMAGEGQKGLAKRVQAWEKHNGIKLAGAPFFYSEMPARLLDEDFVEFVAAQVRETVPECGLLIVDTLSRHKGDGEENSNDDISRFVSVLVEKFREPLGASIMVLHHTGHTEADRMRGASAMKADADFVIKLSKVKDEPYARLKPQKIKDGGNFSEVDFEAVNVEMANTAGGAEYSLAVKLAEPGAIVKDPGEHKERRTLKKDSKPAKAMSLFAKLVSRRMDRNPNADAEIALSYFRDQIVEAEIDEPKYTKRLVDRLVEQGWLFVTMDERVQFGPASEYRDS